VVASYLTLFHLSVCSHEFIRLVIQERKCDSITETVSLNLKLGYLSFQNKIKLFERGIDINILSFCQCRNENECFLWRSDGTLQSGRIQKYIKRLLKEFQVNALQCL